MDPHIIFSYAAVGYFPFQCAEGLRSDTAVRVDYCRISVVGYLLYHERHAYLCAEYIHDKQYG